MLSQLSLPGMVPRDDEPRTVIDSMLHLRDKLLLVGTGHRRGCMFGLFIEAARASRLLLARVEPWPRLSVSCSIDCGRTWVALSDAAATRILKQLSEHYGDGLAVLSLQKFEGRLPPWARCPNFFGRRVLHREHLIRFMSTMPFKVRARADAEAGRLVLFRLYARCPQSEDLYAHDRTLTQMLAVHWMIRKEREPDWETVSGLLARNRRMLLAFVGLRPARWMRRVLNWFAGSFGIIDQAPAIVVLLNTPGYAEAIRRTPWVVDWRSGVLEILSRNQDVAQALVRTHYAPSVWRSDAFRYEISNAIEFADRFGNACRFLDLEYSDHGWTIPMEVLATLPLPEPPWEGTDAIVPLRIVAEVRQEGEVMDNCLREPAQLMRAARGDMHVYRVMAPVRATLSLLPNGERYEIEGPLGKANQRLPDEVVQAVRRIVPTCRHPCPGLA